MQRSSPSEAQSWHKGHYDPNKDFSVFSRACFSCMLIMHFTTNLCKRSYVESKLNGNTRNWRAFWFRLPLSVQLYIHCSDTAKPVTGNSNCLGKHLRDRKGKSKWILGSKPKTKQCKFFSFFLSWCVHTDTQLSTLEEEDRGKEIEKAAAEKKD